MQLGCVSSHTYLICIVELPTKACHDYQGQLPRLVIAGKHTPHCHFDVLRMSLVS